MSTVLLVAHHERVEAAALARTATEWLAAHGHTDFMCEDDATALHLPDMATGRAPDDADLAVSLGGDGTMLRTVKLVGGREPPDRKSVV